MRGSSPLYVFGALILTYLALSLLLPPDPESLARYDLTVSALRMLNLAIVVPLAIIWSIIFYGYLKLRRYSQLIESSPEGGPVAWIARGVMVLVYSLPVTSIVSQLMKYIGRDDTVTAATTVVTNYVTLLFPLVAFVLIGIGARGLTDMSKQRISRLGAHLIIILFALAGVSYSYFVLHFAFSNHAGAEQVYAMPLWLVLTTLVVPYLYTWYVGIVAAYEMYVYNKAVKGVLYRRGWSMLSVGLGAIIVTLIVIQFLTTLTVQLNSLSLSAILLLVYGLLLLMAIGYVMVAYGAKQLQKIEEV